VKRLCIPALAACLLTLTTCSALFRGVFPGDLAQARAQADLSADIPAEAASTFSLAIVKQGGTEFVLLLSADGFSPSSAHLFVFGSDLTLNAAFDLDSIAALPPLGVGFKGRGAVARHVDGRLIVGNIEMQVVAGSLVAVRKLVLPSDAVAMDRWAIAGPSSASFTWTGFNASNGRLEWSAYESDWSGMARLSAPIGVQGSLSGVFANPEADTINTAYLVFRQSSDKGKASTSWFVRVPMDGGLTNGLGGGDIVTNESWHTFTMNGLGPEPVYMTSDSIVAYEESTGSWIRFSPDDPANVQRVSLGSRDETLQTAFSFAGHFYCVWNPSVRTLTAYDTWW
jgi:hypothetical protein